MSKRRMANVAIDFTELAGALEFAGRLSEVVCAERRISMQDMVRIGADIYWDIKLVCNLPGLDDAPWKEWTC